MTKDQFKAKALAFILARNNFTMLGRQDEVEPIVDALIEPFQKDFNFHNTYLFWVERNVRMRLRV